MPKILAVIENDMYVRNFITSGAFDHLLKNPDFKICISERVEKLQDKIPEDKFIGNFTRIKHNIKLIYKYNQVSMRYLKDKSSTFKIKARVKLGVKNNKDLFYYRFWSNKLFFSSFKRKIKNKFIDNKSLRKIIEKFKPDLVIFPITGVEATGAELVVLSKKFNFKTYFLINGWDNLSSKGIFPYLPDYMGIWGPQSLVDAVNIQGIKFDKTFLLGSSRYDEYFKFKKNKKVQKLFPYKYILFAGSTTANDEIGPLKKFDEVLSELGKKDIKIVYRPHPWREKRNCFDLFEEDKYTNTILDPQIRDNYYNEKNKRSESVSSKNYPELSYYPNLINNALFVISPMSSMTLEAALFDVPALILAYNDGYHKIPGNLQAKYCHFAGAKDISGWTFIEHKSDLKSIFKNMILKFENESYNNRFYKNILSNSMKKYIYIDNNLYSDRLKESVDIINT